MSDKFLLALPLVIAITAMRLEFLERERMNEIKSLEESVSALEEMVSEEIPYFNYGEPYNVGPNATLVVLPDDSSIIFESENEDDMHDVLVIRAAMSAIFGENNNIPIGTGYISKEDIDEFYMVYESLGGRKKLR